MPRLVVSIHDVTMALADELQLIFADLDQLGVVDRSELVVPEYRHASGLQEQPEFCRLLREHKQRGIDVSLHGLYHEYAEFLRAGAKGAAMLAEARAKFEDALGFAPIGFVAPQWFQCAAVRRAVSAQGFGYNATWLGVATAAGQWVRAFPVNYDWGLPVADAFFVRWNAWRCDWRRSGVLRFSIHPLDVRHRVWEREKGHLCRLLERGWQPCSYATLAGEGVHG